MSVLRTPSSSGNTTGTKSSSRSSWARRNSLMVLLLFTCVTMCAVAFEQNRTISSQQELIRSLFRDSIELNAMKMHIIDSNTGRR